MEDSAQQARQAVLKTVAPNGVQGSTPWSSAKYEENSACLSTVGMNKYERAEFEYQFIEYHVGLVNKEKL